MAGFVYRGRKPCVICRKLEETLRHFLTKKGELIFGLAAAGRLRGPGRDGAATDWTDAAYPSASEAPVLWSMADVKDVS